jgi:hypothetical protein
MTPRELYRIFKKKEPQAAFFDRVDLVIGLTENLYKEERRTRGKIKELNNSKEGYSKKLKKDMIDLYKNANETGLGVIRDQRERIWRMFSGELRQYEEHSGFLYRQEIKKFL